MPARTIDLIGTLARIQAEAERARHQFEKKEAVNGRSSLRRIEVEASDCLVRLQEKRP